MTCSKMRGCQKAASFINVSTVPSLILHYLTEFIKFVRELILRSGVKSVISRV